MAKTRKQRIEEHLEVLENKERVLLSEERTALALLRTALATITIGFAIMKLSENDPFFYAASFVVGVVGILLLVYGVMRFENYRKETNRTMSKVRSLSRILKE